MTLRFSLYSSIESNYDSSYYSFVLLERYLSADLSIFLFLVLLMISVLHYRNRRARSVQSSLFKRLCDSTLIMMGLDVVFRFIDGGDSYYLSYATTWLYFFIEPLPMVFWLCYLDYYLYKSRERLRKRFYYFPVFSIIFVLLVVDPLTHWVFSISDDNYYQRGPLIPLIVFFNIIILAVTIIVALKRKKDVGRSVFLSLVMFSVIPLLGNLMQFLIPGTILVWPTVAIAVVYIFIFMETQKDRKDYLTGLFNKQQIDDLIQRRLSHPDKEHGFTILMIDLDDFKGINDNFGHKEGDRALVKAAEILFHSVRSIDKVARFGGDEFLILLEEDHKDEIEKVIVRIESNLRKYNQAGHVPYELKLSCGYKLVHPGNDNNLYDLIHEADLEMYRVKKTKKQGQILMACH